VADLRQPADHGGVAPLRPAVNRKRVQRVMREDNLLCLRKRKFVATTDSAHGLKVYPNLAAALVVSGVNQLWRADITYSTPSQRRPPLWG
jgi:transposase InsO family protein